MTAVRYARPRNIRPITSSYLSAAHSTEKRAAFACSAALSGGRARAQSAAPGQRPTGFTHLLR